MSFREIFTILINKYIGITFSTNSETLRERLIPFDLIPRIFTNLNCSTKIIKVINLYQRIAKENGDRNIDSHIKRLRKKFREARPDINFNRITTHYGSGYAWSPQTA